VCLPFAVVRAKELAPAASIVTAQDRLEDQFPALLGRVGGPARVRGCRRFTVDGFFRPAMAWRLGVPVARLVKFKRPPLLLFRLSHRAERSLGDTERHSRLHAARPASLIARLRGWEVIASRRLSACTPLLRAVRSSPPSLRPMTGGQIANPARKSRDFAKPPDRLRAPGLPYKNSAI
jgi:hypothetical protein